MADYALIKIIDSVEKIDNVIVADSEVAATYLVANGGDYDYVLDVSLYDPEPGIGWTYDSGEDTFSAPPEDFEAELEEAFTAVDTAIEECLDAYLSASEGQRATAIGNVMSLLSEEDEDEIDLMSAVVDFLAGRVE